MSIPRNLSVLATSISASGILGVAAGGTGITTASAASVFAAPTLSAGAPTFRVLTLEDIPDSWVKKSVRAATTANITLSAPQTIDGIVLVAGDRVLVKAQTTAASNGIYVVAAAAWARSLDANTISKLAGAQINIDSGTVNGGLVFDCDLKTTDVLDTAAVNFYRTLDTAYTIPITQGGTGAITAAAAKTALGVMEGQFFGTAAIKAIAYNSNSIAENVTITTGNNGLSAGPITITNGFAVTVADGATWVIL